MNELVTIGVPVYKGQLFVEEALDSIRRQTYENIRVFISLDGPDPTCEEICRRYLKDPRFQLAVQPRRLGWVGNINWLMSQVKEGFWYYHQQDDITAETYVETLLHGFEERPGAVLVYCDMEAFDKFEGLITQESITGATAFEREMSLLRDHFAGTPFRGLTRAATLKHAGPIPTNDCEDFAVDLAWLAAVALSGELFRVDAALYRKRYHAESTHLKWFSWTLQKRIQAWSAHCVNMLEQAMRVEGRAEQRRDLWAAALDRLMSLRIASAWLKDSEMTRQDRETMFENFMSRARSSLAPRAQRLLGAPWKDIYVWSATSYGMPLSTAVAVDPRGWFQQVTELATRKIISGGKRLLPAASEGGARSEAVAVPDSAVRSPEGE